MDMSFANQALSVEYLLRHHDRLSNKVHPVPGRSTGNRRLKLAATGVRVDLLTAEQRKYLASWEMGT